MKKSNNKLFGIGFIAVIIVMGAIFSIKKTDIIINQEEINNIQSSSVIDGNLEVHFIDVGQADCILVKNNNNAMLIDAGNNDDGDIIKSYLKEQNITRLDYVIGTHPHEDHIGGLDIVINNYDIGTIIMPRKTTTTKTFEDVVKAVKNKGLVITNPVVGTKYALGGAEFTILAPNKDYGDELNNYSVGVRLVYRNNSFVFTGDAEAEAEKDIMATGLELKADVLKLGHHGSSTSTSSQFLKTVSPKYAVITCGKDNDYGHPHKETMEKVKNIDVYRTDEQGNIIAISDGNNITWNTKKSVIKPVVKEENKAVKYILNTNSKKIHYADCESVSKMSEKNKAESSENRSELIAKGYSPCGICEP